MAIQIVADGLNVGLASSFSKLRPRHNIEIVTFTEVDIQTNVVKFSSTGHDDRPVIFCVTEVEAVAINKMTLKVKSLIWEILYQIRVRIKRTTTLLSASHYSDYF